MEQPYVYILDPYPQQTPEQTRLYPFFEHLRDGRLTTSKCKRCGALPWPPRVVCPTCMSDDLEWSELPLEGKIYGYTVQEAGLPPGYDPPVVFALIDLANGVRLLSVIEDSDISEIESGANVELIVKNVPYGRVMPAFRLKK
ncbi:MAG: Zn-ribbon domain-containing OB-fold protein [Chloroflexi bacterium]|nr:Zn-ribbon domain-containing OB-fold protein [Chloroflexota bacterium]